MVKRVRPWPCVAYGRRHEAIASGDTAPALHTLRESYREASRQIMIPSTPAAVAPGDDGGSAARNVVGRQPCHVAQSDCPPLGSWIESRRPRMPVWMATETSSVDRDCVVLSGQCTSNLHVVRSGGQAFTHLFEVALQAGGDGELEHP